MRIDCQTHIFPVEYAEVLAQNPEWPQTLVEADQFVLTYKDAQTFVMGREAYGVKRKLNAMDAAGIDISALSVNMPGPENLAPELAVPAARAGNDALAEAVAQHPDRFVGLACLPWQSTTDALAELERAVVTLGHRGVMLYSHIVGVEVDDLALDPLYRRIAELGVPVVLHPSVPPWAEAIKHHSMIPMAGLMVHQSFATLQLILGGVLERHPQLKVVQPHCGGVLPYIWGRVEHQTGTLRRGRAQISQPVGSYYERVYLDVVSPWPPALRLAYEFAGSDRLLFASDHPWVEIDVLSRLVEDMDIPAEDKDDIFGRNACALFGIGG